MADKKPKSWGKFARDLAVIVAAIAITKTAIAEPFYVPSGSMEPTLLIGDELLTMKFPYGYAAASLPAPLTWGAGANRPRLLAAMPARGDIVVFRWPGDRSQVWVKRAIGLPGDRIAMAGGQVWINGKPAGLESDGMGEAEVGDGTRVPAARFIEHLPGGFSHPIFKMRTPGSGSLDRMDEVIVPAGHVFVLGDNRDNSSDSRVPVAEGGVGLLPVEDLVGRADALIASWDLATRHKPVWTWPSGLRLSRFFTALH